AAADARLGGRADGGAADVRAARADADRHHDLAARDAHVAVRAHDEVVDDLARLLADEHARAEVRARRARGARDADRRAARHEARGAAGALGVQRLVIDRFDANVVR